LRRAVTDATAFAALAGLAVGVVATLQPGDTSLALDAYMLFLGALAMSVLTRATRHATGRHPSAIEARLRPRRWWKRERPQRHQLPELARVERELSLASVGAFDLHVRLRPTLRTVAAYRLLSRHGIGLDEQPGRARELLGETTWEIVQPDREPPLDRHGPGLPIATLEEVVSSLERL
jgi:hypothetical protein